MGPRDTARTEAMEVINMFKVLGGESQCFLKMHFASHKGNFSVVRGEEGMGVNACMVRWKNK